MKILFLEKFIAVTIFRLNRLSVFVLLILTASKRSLQRFCFYTCLSFCPRGAGAGLPQCMLGYPPPPRNRPPEYRQQAGGMHPTGMHCGCDFIFNATGSLDGQVYDYEHSSGSLI